MAISLPCYCTREDAVRSIDFQDSMITNARIDRAIQSASRNIEGHLHRVFYPRDTTYKWDWPNYRYAYPWRLWFDQFDLISATLVESPHGTTIPLGNVILLPANRKPGWPYTYMELDRSTSSAFGAGPTPQLAIWVTGTWGFNLDTDPAGTLAAAITTTSATTATVSDGSLLGVGDLLIIDTERLVVSDRAASDTGLAQAGTGCTTASSSDNILGTTGTGTLNAGEVVVLDGEQMLITQIVNGAATVQRAWNGTVLATHSGAEVYALRLLTVSRGQLGTTAATHLISAAISRHRPPALIRDLAIAEATNRVLQETSGYARTVGSGEAAMPATGAGLADLWDEAMTSYGRKARKRAI